MRTQRINWNLWAALLGILALLSGCAGSGLNMSDLQANGPLAAQANVSNAVLQAPTLAPANTPLPLVTSPVVTTTSPLHTPSPSSTLSPGDSLLLPTSPSPTVTTTPTSTAHVTGTQQVLIHSLPDTPVVVDVPLLYQPDGFEIAPTKIPSGDSVILLGRDESQAWYRVFWQGYFGWIPAKVTHFPPSKVIELRAPPPCARARTFRQGLDSEWISSSEGQIAVVIDLYRSTFGNEFPRSTLLIQVNSVPVQGKERTISSRGEFLTRGAVIPIAVKKQDRVGFQLMTTSVEDVKLFATIFSVPDGCTFQEQ